MTPDVTLIPNVDFRNESDKRMNDDEEEEKKH